MIDELKNLKKKWRARATKEEKMAHRLFEKRAMASGEKSMGITIGYNVAAQELENVIKKYEVA